MLISINRVVIYPVFVSYIDINIFISTADGWKFEILISLFELEILVEISDFKPLIGKSVAAARHQRVRWCRRWKEKRGLERSKVVEKEEVEESKRSPAWSALSARSCERARMRLHRGDWNTTTANCSNAGEQGTPLLPLFLSLVSACPVIH